MDDATREAEEVAELRAHGWTPSTKAPTGWDDPARKLVGVPRWRALEIARRDAAREGTCRAGA